MFRLQMKSKNKSSGSSVGTYLYISRYDKNNPNSKELVFEKAHIPKCYNNPLEFWKSVESNERKNGNLYKELLISLPREIKFKDIDNLMNKFTKKVMGASVPYSYAVHNKKASDNKDNTHIHLMYYPKKVPIKYYLDGNLDFNKTFNKSSENYIKKSKKLTTKEFLYKARQGWENIVNEYVGKNIISEKNIKRELMEMYGMPYESIKGFVFAKDINAKTVSNLNMLFDKSIKTNLSIKQFEFERATKLLTDIIESVNLNNDTNKQDYYLKNNQTINEDLKQLLIIKHNVNEDMANLDKLIYLEMLDATKKLKLGYKGALLMHNLTSDFNDDGVKEISLSDYKQALSEMYININTKHKYIENLEKEFNKILEKESFNNDYNLYVANMFTQELVNAFNIELGEKAQNNLIKLRKKGNLEFNLDVENLDYELSKLVKTFKENYFNAIKDYKLTESDKKLGLTLDKIPTATNIIKDFATNVIANDLVKEDSIFKKAYNESAIFKNSSGGIINVLNELKFINGSVYDSNNNLNLFEIEKEKFKASLKESFITLSLVNLINNIRDTDVTLEEFYNFVKANEKSVNEYYLQSNVYQKELFKDIIGKLENIKGKEYKDFVIGKTISVLEIQNIKNNEKLSSNVIQTQLTEARNNAKKVCDYLGFSVDAKIDGNVYIGLIEKNLKQIKEKMISDIMATYNITTSMINFVNKVQEKDNSPKIMFNIGIEVGKINMSGFNMEESTNQFLSNLKVSESNLKNSFTTNNIYKVTKYGKGALDKLIQKAIKKIDNPLEKGLDFANSKKVNKYTFTNKIMEHIKFNNYNKRAEFVNIKDNTFNDFSVIKAFDKGGNIVFDNDKKDAHTRYKKQLEEMKKLELRKDNYIYEAKEMEDLLTDYEMLEKDIVMSNKLIDSLEKDIDKITKEEKKLNSDFYQNLESGLERITQVKEILKKTNEKTYGEYVKETNNISNQVFELSKERTVSKRLEKKEKLLSSIKRLNELEKVANSIEAKDKVDKFTNDHKETIYQKHNDTIKKKVLILNHLNTKMQHYYKRNKDRVKDEDFKDDKKKIFISFMEKINELSILQQETQRQLNVLNELERIKALAIEKKKELENQRLKESENKSSSEKVMQLLEEKSNIEKKIKSKLDSEILIEFNKGEIKTLSNDVNKVVQNLIDTNSSKNIVDKVSLNGKLTLLNIGKKISDENVRERILGKIRESLDYSRKYEQLELMEKTKLNGKIGIEFEIMDKLEFVEMVSEFSIKMVNTNVLNELGNYGVSKKINDRYEEIAQTNYGKNSDKFVENVEENFYKNYRELRARL